ncbi:proline-rich receptor-like protein kinase PERK8 [Schistocerca piceifrons]|uniref:proline-rich receptor-like protein kinase PERK8 n=1 Tax=Schistocerca piceifrons TaxID=274613 RepID=UPI001F5EB4A6|nr:proline-rich receptor-like protein kinase PERK8 [Schistocerca piceifrons]
MLVIECNRKPSVVSIDRIKPAYILPAPAVTHFFDPAEDLVTDDTPRASGQTEPAPVAAGDVQLQPAVITSPPVPPTTPLRQPAWPPGTCPPQPPCQQTTSRTPAVTSNSNGRAASPMRRATQNSKHTPKPPNAIRMRRPRAAIQCRDPAPAVCTLSRYLQSSPGQRLPCPSQLLDRCLRPSASAASGI